LDAVLSVNENQSYQIIELLKKPLIDLNNKNILMLGTAFKPGTDDVRESQAVEVIKLLNDGGAKIQAYDPEAAEVEGIERAETMENALEGADICLVLTEWPEFENVPFSGKIIDGRNIVKNRENYEGLFW
ncbi:MAG: UDP binding domain-containing protein, partial [archaeon]|nr:UDP binding domain-containing protein [archaeon]